MDKIKVIHTIEETGIIAIVRGTKAEYIVDTARALYEGGIRVIEVTCNTPGYLKVIEKLAEALGDQMWIGAGTVLNPIMAELVISAGARFALAPDLNPEVVQILHEKKKLMIPGVSTPSEMTQAHRLGIDLLKLFPAGALGAQYLKEIRGPLHDAQIIPVGGITLGNVKEFAQNGAFAVGIGGELVDKTAIASGRYDDLTRKASAFMAAFHEGRRERS